MPGGGSAGAIAGPLRLASAAILALPLLAAPGPARAQTTVNPGALDLLPARPAPDRPAPRGTAARPPHHPAPAHAAPPRPGTAAATAQPPAQAAPPKPAIPTVPPAIAALPPPAPVPAPRPLPAAVAPVAADAPGSAEPEPNGLRITFGPGREELNPATEAALRGLARSLRGGTGGVNVLAYAAGSPDDPSTARRLSLQRALATRAVLINEGVASSRIYPRALGSAGGDTDPDRVDVLPQATGQTGNAPAGQPAGATLSGQAARP